MDKQFLFHTFDVTDSVFAQSDGSFAIYNRSPVLPGHSLVIPNEKIESLIEMKEEQLESYFSFARKVSSFLMKEFEGEGFDWSLQDGESAGQTVPHLHLHILPRYKNDLPNPRDWYPKVKESEVAFLESDKRPPITDEQRTQIVSHLKESWKKFNKN